MVAGVTPSRVSDATALAALEAGGDEVGQALALLAAAGVAEPQKLTLGSGDRLLLEVHRALTGRDVELTVPCPACETVNVATLGPDSVPPERPRSAALGVRPPTYADLIGLPDDPETAELELLRRCTLGDPESPAAPRAFEAVDDSLAGPLELACVECGGALRLGVDVERVVLEGLQRHVGSFDLDVHDLAQAYGWSLAEIESLPDPRRRRLAILVRERW